MLADLAVRKRALSQELDKKRRDTFRISAAWTVVSSAFSGIMDTPPAAIAITRKTLAGYARQVGFLCRRRRLTM